MQRSLVVLARFRVPTTNPRLISLDLATLTLRQAPAAVFSVFFLSEVGWGGRGMAMLAAQFPGLLIREWSSDNPDGLVWIEVLGEREKKREREKEREQLPVA